MPRQPADYLLNWSHHVRNVVRHCDSWLKRGKKSSVHVPSLGHLSGSQYKAIARPCGQPHWSTSCLTLLMDWVMSNNPKVIRTFDACSRHSCRSYQPSFIRLHRHQHETASWRHGYIVENAAALGVMKLGLLTVTSFGSGQPAGHICVCFGVISKNTITT